MELREVMREAVVCVRAEMPLAELEEVLLREHIGGVPVLEGDRVVGVVSRSDVVRTLQLERSRVESTSAFYLEPFDAEQRTERDDERVTAALAARLKELRVEDAMVRELIRVGPDESLQKVAQAMLERRVHRLLVMDGERLLGIVSSLDLVRLFAEGRVG